MYIKKSVISGIILVIGISVLAVLAILYSFTEIHIPQMIYVIAWGGCIVTMAELIHKVENGYMDSSVK